MTIISRCGHCTVLSNSCSLNIFREIVCKICSFQTKYLYMKICTRCNLEKVETEFHIKRSTKSGLAFHCKDCERIAHRKHYLLNKTVYVNRAIKNTAKKNRLYKEWKAQFSCTFCSESDPACIDFHHNDPNTKKSDVSAILANRGLKSAQREALKCIPLCSNCHRKLHAYGIDKFQLP